MQQPSNVHSELGLLERFRDNVEVFWVEAYRCKLCKFHSAVKANMVTHMSVKHPTRMSAPVFKSEASSAMTHISARSSAGSTPHCISVELEASSSTIATEPKIKFGNVGSIVTATIENTTCSSADTGFIVKQDFQSDAVATVDSALELLMGIGGEADRNALILKLNSGTSAIKDEVETSGGDVLRTSSTSNSLSGDEMQLGPVGSILQDQSGETDSRTNSKIVSQSCAPIQQDSNLVTYKLSRNGTLLKVNEEELAKTLRMVDDVKNDSEQSSDCDPGADASDSSDETERASRVDINKQAAASQPAVLPVKFDLKGSLNPDIDIQDIANKASKSNPRATTITVLHHQGDEPPTAFQFKKSRKSDAVIPTGESLGIASLFASGQAYRGKKTFICASCGARYKSVGELNRHVKKKHQRLRRFLCEICGEALATRASVKYHVSKKHADPKVRPMYYCQDCDYSTPHKARWTIHRGKHKSEFKCDLCQRSYVSADRLTKHYKSPMHKNALYPLVCEHCGYSTKKRDNFLVHMRKHTGEKPYKCKMCSYASADGSTLKKHVMAKHSSIRPFKCDVCTFSCVDKKGLDIHIRKHTGERPFSCPHCQYAAKRRSALNVHLQSHSKDSQSQPKLTESSPAGLKQPTEEGTHNPLHTPEQYTNLVKYEPPTLVTEVQIVPQSPGQVGDATVDLQGSVDAKVVLETDQSTYTLTPMVKSVHDVWENI